MFWAEGHAQAMHNFRFQIWADPQFHAQIVHATSEY
jgi:hypothetical protein